MCSIRKAEDTIFRDWASSRAKHHRLKGLLLEGEARNSLFLNRFYESLLCTAKSAEHYTIAAVLDLVELTEGEENEKASCNVDDYGPDSRIVHRGLDLSGSDSDDTEPAGGA